MADKGAILKHKDINGVRQETGTASPLPVEVIGGGGGGVVTGAMRPVTVVPQGTLGTNLTDYIFNLEDDDYILTYEGFGSWGGYVHIEGTYDGKRWQLATLLAGHFSGVTSGATLGSTSFSHMVVAGFRQIRFRINSITGDGFTAATSIIKYAAPPIQQVALMHQPNVIVGNAISTQRGASTTGTQNLLGANATWMAGMYSRGYYTELRVATFSDVAGEIVVVENFWTSNGQREVLRHATTAGQASRVKVELHGNAYGVKYINGPTAQTVNDIYTIALT